MGTFFLFGKYSAASVDQISGARTAKARQAIENLGGEVKQIYALLGQFDLVLIVQLPSMADAMKASIALGRLTDIAFSTAAAVPVEEFDQMVADL